MMIVDRFLRFLTHRAFVRPQAVTRQLRYPKAELKEKGFRHLDCIPDSVGMVIIQDAYRRAAEKEKDGFARDREFDVETKMAADKMIAAFENSPDVDPRIKNILTFNRVL